jgi:hypothetical protein
MNKKMSKRTIVVVVILLLLAGGVVTWNMYKRHLAKKGVQDTVANKTNGLYGMEVGKLDFDEVAGNLSVTNVQLTADSNVYSQLESVNDAPSVVMNISIPSLTVAGVQTPRALLSSEIVGRKVMIMNPRIELLFTGRGKDSLKSVPDKEVYRQILGNLEMIKIDTLSIVNATLVTRDKKTGNIRMQLDSVTIDLFRIAVDSAHDKDTTRILFAEQVEVNVKTARWTSKNKLYNYKVRDVKVSSGEKKLSVNEVSINPSLPEQKFLQQFKYATDRFDVSFYQVRMAGVSIPMLLRQQVAADSLVSGRSSIHIYRDLSFPHDKQNRVGTYPGQAIMKLPIALTIKTAVFNNSFIEYKERNAKSEKSGKVQFYNAGVRVDNLTNNKKLLAEKSMRIQFNAQFLNKAATKAVIHFPASNNGKFTIEGDVGGMPAETVNILTEPMGLARVEHGTLTSLHFEFTGNDYGTDGKLVMLYDDLKLSLLKKDSVDNTLDKKGLVSLLANMKVKDANPGKKGEIRQATVHYDRDVSKSFFNLIWKSVFTGIKESVGIN